MDYYGSFAPAIHDARKQILEKLESLPFSPEHISSRIKSPASIENKLKSKGYNPGIMSALRNLYDVIGIRVIVRFIDEIYDALSIIASSDLWNIDEIKDYVEIPKPNGYRSVHVLISLPGGMHAEIQIRTIAQDCWAALEHEIKYKKEIGAYSAGQLEVINRELKRCADEIASTDLTMQTIKDLMNE